MCVCLQSQECFAFEIEVFSQSFILEQSVKYQKQCVVFCKECVAELQIKCKEENVLLLLVPLFQALEQKFKIFTFV